MANYCSVCGAKKDPNAKFCSECGATLESTSLSERQQYQVQNNSDYDRDAVLVHLNDLCAIECGIIELANQIRRCDNYICNAAKPKKITEPVDNSSGGIGVIIGGIAVGLICPIIGWIIDDVISIVKSSSTFTTIGWFIWFIIAICSLVSGIKAQSSMKTKYESDYAEYRRNVENDGKRVQSEIAEKQRVTALRNGLYNEYLGLSNIRDKVYSVNIIPNDFRNVYCVYSVYNYMATSSGSLNEALLHCDLRIIQQQLEKIIDQNKTIILNQYIQQAQNKELIDLNQRKIMHLKNIETNTERSAQYSKIAAENAEVCNYMLTATYLRDMIR